MKKFLALMILAIGLFTVGFSQALFNPIKPLIPPYDPPSFHSKGFDLMHEDADLIYEDASRLAITNLCNDDHTPPIGYYPVEYVNMAPEMETIDNCYFPLRINEKVHFQDVELDSCFVLIERVAIGDLCPLTAMIWFSVYKSEDISIENPSWRLTVNEIPLPITLPIGAMFSEGDIFEKVSIGVKEYLLFINPTWKASNIVIVK
jgi:hypothetical protein